MQCITWQVRFSVSPRLRTIFPDSGTPCTFTRGGDLISTLNNLFTIIFKQLTRLHRPANPDKVLLLSLQFSDALGPDIFSKIRLKVGTFKRLWHYFKRPSNKCCILSISFMLVNQTSLREQL